MERSASIRLRNKQDDEMDDDGYSTIPGPDIKEGKCRDHDGYEMIDSSENSQVFGLSNHGNKYVLHQRHSPSILVTS